MTYPRDRRRANLARPQPLRPKANPTEIQKHGTRTKASTLYGILESYVDDPNLSPDIDHYAKQQLDSLLPF